MSNLPPPRRLVEAMRRGNPDGHWRIYPQILFREPHEVLR